MANMAVAKAFDIRDLIRTKLTERPYQPVELLSQLQQVPGISEMAVKDALATMIEERLIELSADRRIKLREYQHVGTLRRPR